MHVARDNGDQYNCECWGRNGRMEPKVRFSRGSDVQIPSPARGHSKEALGSQLLDLSITFHVSLAWARCRQTGPGATSGRGRVGSNRLGRGTTNQPGRGVTSGGRGGSRGAITIPDHEREREGTHRPHTPGACGTDWPTRVRWSSF